MDLLGDCHDHLVKIFIQPGAMVRKVASGRRDVIDQVAHQVELRANSVKFSLAPYGIDGQM